MGVLVRVLSIRRLAIVLGIALVITAFMPRGFSENSLSPSMSITSEVLLETQIPMIGADDASLLNFSSFLGGGGDEYYISSDCDAAGNIYVAGTTDSRDFPLVNPLDGVVEGHGNEGFLTKINPNGTIIYSTYIGGASYDEIYDIFVDDAGFVYLVGTTGSADFPTVNAADSTLSGADCFVCKINQAGSDFVYSTFIGGSSGEYAKSIFINEQGEAYVAGETDSSNFPTINPYDSSLDGFNDCFVSKLSQGGNALLYSTLFGGGYYEEVAGIAVDNEGAIYVSGTTWSSDFPTQNGIDSMMSGDYDTFVLKLNPSGTSLNYSTFLGGNDVEHATSVGVDSLGRAYALGFTTSTDFPTERPLHGSYAGNLDGFLTVFNPDGMSLNYSTYFGTDGAEWPQDLVVNGVGSVYVCGSSNALGSMIDNSYDSSFNGGADAFVFRMDIDRGVVLLGSYLGGTLLDEAMSVSVDNDGTMYVSGWTLSENFPMRNPVDSTYDPGGYNGFDVFVSIITDNSDYDLDGIPDYIEAQLGTDSFNPDTDFDLLGDYLEVYLLGTNPLSNCTYGNGTLDGDLDHDGDNLTNVEELYEYGTDLLSKDSDLDLLEDGFEVYVVGSLPSLFDSDFDLLSDWQEYMVYNTDCLSEDTDQDFMSDGYEVYNGLDPLVDDAAGDLDGDSLTNLEESIIRTSANNTDSDSDSLPDYWEVSFFLNPMFDDGLWDNDDDELTNIAEYQTGCSPIDNDCDRDTLEDGYEVLILGTNPLSSDSDLDSLPDGWEVDYGLDPLVDDTTLDEDSDGLSNLQEYELGTRPDLTDTDMDTYSDRWEVENGFNPTNPYVPLIQSVYSKLPAILVLIAMPLTLPGFYAIGQRMKKKEEIEIEKEVSKEIEDALDSLSVSSDSED